MVKLWQNEAVDWLIQPRVDAENEPLTLRVGADGRTLELTVGQSPTLELVRRAAAKGLKTARELGGRSVLLDASGLNADEAAALLQGAELAAYRQESWKSDPKPPVELYVTGADGDALAETAAVTRGVCFARDLVNCPANRLTPEQMAQRMAQAAEAAGLEVEILDEHDARALGMGAFLAVGDSAGHPPRLIVLRWRGGRPENAPIALVGKGVCCDTGGYCLKSAAGLRGMKGDMAGGAAVCGALLALAENRVPVNAVAVIPAVENRISPDSNLPGDVVISMSGKSIEIANTDAEGRLILADAVTYAIQKEHASRVVDIATLTGAIVRMLGFTTAGLLTNNEEFCAELQSAAAQSGEQYWRMPDFPEYRRMIDSPLADLCNQSSDGCGAITAGLFIGAFAEHTPWIHLDIAGTAWTDRPRREYQVKGATGAGVTTLYELCKRLADG